MMMRAYLFWALLVVVSVHCFQRLQQQTRRATFDDSSQREQPPQQIIDIASKSNLFPPKIRDQLALQGRRMLAWDSPQRQTKSCTCPPEHGAQEFYDDEDVISDVGEAAFAMLGSIWAEEGIIPTSILFPDGANNSNDDGRSWIGEQHDHAIHDKDLTRTRIRAVVEGLANHPYADEGNLDSISAHILQHT